MGEAASYFQPGQQGQGYNQGYNQQNQQGYNQGQGMEYQKPPPEQPPFGQQQPPFGQQQPPPQQQYSGQPPTYGYQPPQPGTEKYSFDDAFKVEKPKWNDLWAGILVSSTRGEVNRC
jgi:hypothetical protein